MMTDCKIGLISPQAVASENLVKRVQPPLGLACIAAMLLEAGYENLLVIDAIVEGYDHEEQLDDEPDLYQYGLSNEEISSRVLDFGAKIVGISSLFSSQASCALSIAHAVKKVMPDILVVIGGNHASNSADQILMENSSIDYVLAGEGDVSFLDFVEAYNKGKDIHKVAGLVWRENGAVKKNPRPPFIKDLDVLPFPAWHLMPMEKYFEIGMPHNPYTKSNRVACIMTSRGCPEQCYFCSSPDYFGRGFRAMSAERAADMVRYLVEQFSVKELQIEDDNFTLNARRVIDFCNRIKQFGLRITLPNAIRADAPRNREKRLKMFKAMRAAGVEQVACSVEHGDQNFLDSVIGKRLKLDEVIATCDLAHKAGLLVHANFIMGFPGETQQHRERTIEFARKLDADSFSVSLATPLPGTKMWDIADKEGLFMDSFNLNRVLYSEVSMQPVGISPEKLKELVETFNKELNQEALSRRPEARDKYKLFSNKSTHGDRKYISLDE